MRTHLLTLFALMLVVGCGGQAADDAAADHTESSDGEDVAAVEALGENWERHYNMGAGHGGMAVSHLTDTAIHWTGSGDMLFGKEAIVARLEEQLEAGGSQLQVDTEEVIFAGNFSAARGTYEVGNSDAMIKGYYITLNENVEGEWTTRGVINNIVEGEALSGGTGEVGDPLEGAALIQGELDYYKTHFNMGHPSMVAEKYTEDAVVMASGAEATMGRAAAEARLQGMLDAGAEISDVVAWQAREMDDQYVMGVGTFAVGGSEGMADGHFAGLYKRADDGGLQIHWLLISNHPSGM